MISVKSLSHEIINDIIIIIHQLSPLTLLFLLCTNHNFYLSSYEKSYKICYIARLETYLAKNN